MKFDLFSKLQAWHAEHKRKKQVLENAREMSYELAISPLPASRDYIALKKCKAKILQFVHSEYGLQILNEIGLKMIDDKLMDVEKMLAAFTPEQKAVYDDLYGED